MVVRLPASDVLVVGAGGAGLMAALKAAMRGASVSVVDRGVLGHSGNTLIGAYSVCAALGYADPRDNPRVHYEDTMRSGQQINNARMVRAYAYEAPERVLEVDAFGARFDRAGTRLAQDMMPGHSYPRACHADRRSGKAIMTGLLAELRRRGGAVVSDDMVALDLISVDGAVCGILGYNLGRNQFTVIPAKTVILATGGAGQLYPATTTASESTGDGVAMAFRGGAEVTDMEFVQFYPIAQCYPKLVDLGPTAVHFMRLRTGARLFNALGEDFVERGIPNWQFTVTRDQLARMVYREIREGRGSPHGGVYISVAHLPPDVVEREYSFGGYFDKMMRLGVDLRKDAVETTVSCHYMMGGIRVDENCFTSVPGLLAAGEVTAGVDGANRLGGNALSAILVFGHRAGMSAAEYARGTPSPGGPAFDEAASELMRRWQERLNRRGEIRPSKVKRLIREAMWDGVAVIRNEGGIRQALTALQELREVTSSRMAVQAGQRPYDREAIDAIDVENMLLVGELIARAALMRRESRGAHYREDYPERDDANWLTNIVLSRCDDGIRVTKAPVVRCEEGGPAI